MLAELAAANAAFAIIKQAFQNTGELASAGNALVNYFDNKNALQKKANARGNRSDLEEFLALEQLKRQEEELKDMMIYCGRPGLWQDWIQFQAQAARSRKEVEAEQVRKRARRLHKLYVAFEWSLIVVVVVCLVIGLFYFAWFLKTYKGSM
jgi:hypothetical protein